MVIADGDTIEMVLGKRKTEKKMTFFSVFLGFYFAGLVRIYIK